MADSFFSINPDERWTIIAQDPGRWRIGIASENGYFIVAERTAFTTEFIDRRTGSFLRSEEA